MFNKIYRINSKIKENNKHNIIPVIIDCELSTLNQYLEPVLEELVNISERKFEFYFGETIKGAGSSYSCYNKRNAFSVKIYQKLKGNMIFLSPHIYPKGPESALKIVLDHNISTTKFSFHPRELYENYDIYCVTGELNEEKIVKTINKFGLESKINIKNIGYPKSDKLYNNLLPARDLIFKKLKLDSARKTIIYAPSWEEGLSAREFGTDLTKTILQNTDFNLLVKLHPCFFVSKKDESYTFYTGGINWEEIFSPFNNNPNFAFVKEFKVDELLTVSDIMITDLSSVALEFLTLEKPVIYLDCPKFEKTFNTTYKQFNDISYSDLLKNPLSDCGRHVGLLNYDYKKVLDDIVFLIKNPDYKIKERKEYSKLLVSHKGTASRMCAEMIVNEFNKYTRSSVEAMI
jgi:CDP-glycerol glycerophosphotransferase (TagB/SpsB family)